MKRIERELDSKCIVDIECFREGKNNFILDLNILGNYRLYILFC